MDLHLIFELATLAAVMLLLRRKQQECQWREPALIQTQRDMKIKTHPNPSLLPQVESYLRSHPECVSAREAARKVAP